MYESKNLSAHSKDRSLNLMSCLGSKRKSEADARTESGCFSFKKRHVIQSKQLSKPLSFKEEKLP